MAWGPVDHQCSKCTAMFADQRERNDHEDECRGDEEEQRSDLEWAWRANEGPGRDADPPEEECDG